MGEIGYAAPLDKFFGIIPMPSRLTQIPGGSSWFLGLHRNRGINVQVIDLSVILTDRLITDFSGAPQSIWASVGGQWFGSVLYNDNHAQFELSDKGFNGRYGANRGILGTGTLNNLFDMVNGNGQMTSGD